MFEGSTDNVENISGETRDRAMVLAECARKMGLDPGVARYNSAKDYMAFWFTDGTRYVIVFCYPSGYLVELHEANEDGDIEAEYSHIKNIRNFLFQVKREKLVSFDKYHEELAELMDMNDDEVKDIIQQFLEDESEEDE